MITRQTPKLLLKKLYFFFIQYKNVWKELKFQRRKNLKQGFYKNKKVTKINDTGVNKILVSKEEPHGTKNHSNTLIDPVVMMLLDHYA